VVLSLLVSILLLGCLVLSIFHICKQKLYGLWSIDIMNSFRKCSDRLIVDYVCCIYSVRYVHDLCLLSDRLIVDYVRCIYSVRYVHDLCLLVFFS
jgi:hypothetical protein